MVGRELNAPLLGHNPSQWPRLRNSELLVTAGSTLCNSSSIFSSNARWKIYASYGSKLKNGIVQGVYHCRCFPVLPGSTVVLRLVPCSLKLNHSTLARVSTSQQSTPTLIGQQLSQYSSCLYHPHHPIHDYDPNKIVFMSRIYKFR